MQTTTISNALMRQEPHSAYFIPAFTGLRAVAAYLVFLHHYNPAPMGTFAYRLFHQGYVGVALFFVLSGFLIYHRYADAFLEQTRWSWQRYLQNRFARIFPLYGLFLLLTVGAGALTRHPMPLPVLVLNITLLKGFSETYLFSGIAQCWSLTVELCFYLLAPFLCKGLKRWGPLPLTALLVGFGLLTWTTMNQIFENPDLSQGAEKWLPFLLFYTFFGRSFEFVTGMWLASRWQRNRLPNVPYGMKTGLLISSSCVLWQSCVTQVSTNNILLNCSEIVVYNAAFPIGIGLFLKGLLSPVSTARRGLSHPFMQALGRSSYAFYLLHIGVVARGAQKAGITNYWLLFGLMVLIAHGLYIWIEQPLHRWLKFRKF